jgi:clan AA aspartic protease (TIGR02281 family)
VRRALGCLALACALAATAAHGEWMSGGGSEVPLDGDGRSWIVRARLNGSFTGLFLVDTGATACVLGPATARALDVEESGRSMPMQTANGVVSAPVVRLRTVEVGGNRARDVEAVVHPAVPPPLAGIIGLSYLNNFRYQIDPRRRVLRLQ